MDNIPQHIAFIMDGNRRWAKSKGLDTFAGHEKGINKIEEIVQAASDLGVKYVTVWALSTENLKERSKKEILGLFKLLRKSYKEQFQRMIQNGVKVHIIGEVTGLPTDIKKIINKLNLNLVNSPKINLNIAFNYGGKKEIVRAIRKIVEEGIKVEKIDEQIVEKYLYTYGQPDPDLVIRTGGKIRISNFLIWQASYSEWYFTTKLWPEFSKVDLKKAVKWFEDQKRNFGG